jgi:hypothetical protein
VQFSRPMVRCEIEVLQSAFRRSEHVRDLFLSATPRPCCRRSNRPLPAMPCIPCKRKCAAGST